MKTCVIDLFTLPKWGTDIDEMPREESSTFGLCLRSFIRYAKEAYAEISESLRLFFDCAVAVLCAGSGITVTRYAARDR